MRLIKVLRRHRKVDLWEFKANLIYKMIFRLDGETLTQKQTNKSMIREIYTQKAKTINMEIIKLSFSWSP